MTLPSDTVSSDPQTTLPAPIPNGEEPGSKTDEDQSQGAPDKADGAHDSPGSGALASVPEQTTAKIEPCVPVVSDASQQPASSSSKSGADAAATDGTQAHPRRRRKSKDLPERERWNCPSGCGRFYRSTSTVSIQKHKFECSLLRNFYPQHMAPRSFKRQRLYGDNMAWQPSRSPGMLYNGPGMLPLMPMHPGMMGFGQPMGNFGDFLQPHPNIANAKKENPS